MIVLDGINAKKFKTMFSYIPEKAFPSILLIAKRVGDDVLLKFSDININQSLVVNIETTMTGLDLTGFEDMSCRIPLSKNVKNVIKKFDIFGIDQTVLEGGSNNRKVRLATHVNSDEEIEFPNTASEMLTYAKEMNEIDEVLEAKFTLTKDIIKDLEDCVGVLDISKDSELVFVLGVGKKSQCIAVTSKDTVGNNFRYDIPNIETNDTFKAKYDRDFLYVLKAVKDSKVDGFFCTVSNIMCGVSFEDDDIKVMLAVTIFDKIG